MLRVPPLFAASRGRQPGSQAPLRSLGKSLQSAGDTGVQSGQQIALDARHPRNLRATASMIACRSYAAVFPRPPPLSLSASLPFCR